MKERGWVGKPGQRVLTATGKWEGWVGAGNFTFYTAPRGLLLSKDIEGIFILHGAWRFSKQFVYNGPRPGFPENEKPRM